VRNFVLFLMVYAIVACKKFFFVQFSFEIWHFVSENDILTTKVSLEIEKMDEKNFLTKIYFRWVINLEKIPHLLRGAP